MQKIQMLCGVLLLSVTMGVTAVPITGEIGMGGNFIAVDSNWNATSTAAATGLDFNPNLFIVNSKTGSFSSITSTIGRRSRTLPSMEKRSFFNVSVTEIPYRWMRQHTSKMHAEY